MKYSISRINLSNYWLLTGFFIITKLCLHFFTNTNYELHRDEMLYFNMADHLSFGYATVPPVMGFLAFFVKTISGYSVFGIRLIPALMGAASLFIIAKIVKESGGGIMALVIASTAFLLSPGFLLFDTLFTPNIVEQFLWLLTTYFIFRMTTHDNPRLWIVIGILLGLSFMTKYSVMFYIFGFFIALLFSSYRTLFRSRYFYFTLLFGMIIILPNMLWQYLHGWPVIFHMSELKRTQMVNLKYINFFTDIYSLNLASTIIWLSGLFSLLFFKKEKKNQYLGIASLLIILTFLILKGKGYYILGLIPFLFAYGGLMMEKYLTGKLVIFNYLMIFIGAGFSLVALPFGLPLLSFDKLYRYEERMNHLITYPFQRWEDGRVHDISQIYADMTGWRELAGYVAKAYNQLTPEEKKKCTVYVERDYGAAGAIHFYGKEYNLPDAVTFLESYIMWAPDTIPAGPFIYINNEPGDIKKLFNTVTETGQITDPWSREKGLLVYLCSDPATNVQEVYRKKAFEEKKIYQRKVR